MAEQHSRAARRPVAAALSTLLAAVAFLLLPSSTVAAEVQSQRAGGAAQFTHGSAGVQFGYGKSGAHLSYGHIGSHPETTPPPPFLAPGAGDAARQRAHGGPAARVERAEHVAGRDVAVPRPRGPPNGSGIRVPVDV